jgi:hypothetical protein
VNYKESLLWILIWEIVDVRELVVTLDGTVNYQRLGVDVLVPVSNHHYIKLGPFLFPRLSKHKRRKDPSDAGSTPELITVSQDE